MIKDSKPLGYRLFAKLVDRSKPILKDDLGRTLIPFYWKEVSELSFGSVKYPNHDVIGFKLTPVRMEGKLR